MRREVYYLLILFFIAGTQFSRSQTLNSPDTIRLTLAEIEALFLKNNFSLLAARYQVDEADAAIIQSNLYPNPTLNIDQGAFNPQTKKWFDFTHTGESAASLQQVIMLGGKRNKQFSIAESNSKISKYQFYDLIRTLRYELRSSFYKLNYLEETIKVYDQEIQSLKTLVNGYTKQYENGNISLLEITRLKALLFSLSNERADLIREIDENQNNIQILTGDTLIRIVTPLPDTTYLKKITTYIPDYRRLLDSAMMNRFDLLVGRETVVLNQKNLAFQKSLRVPDITVGANYDRQGSYVNNYNSISMSIDLPLWNRNQGNIKIASFKIDESKENESLVEIKIKTEINMAKRKLIEAQTLYNSEENKFSSDYDKLSDEMIKAYKNHLISLLEFIDYCETTKNLTIERNRLNVDLIEAAENINKATGTDIIK